ncbi:MAG: hypothetical protein FD163_1491 [Hyphomonadaceae bacterium]|nr:MAG: hypothetical protein FD163_1491 [Hyphomonadaceae bacterium]
MKNLIKRFNKNEAGATAIEYGLIAALIAVVLITSLHLVLWATTCLHALPQLVLLSAHVNI